MGDTTVIERIRGVSFAAAANTPFFPDDPGSIFFVERGYLDVFVVETQRARVIGRALFVTRLPEGALAFGCWRGKSEAEPGYSFMAVASQNASIVKGERAAISTREGFDLESMNWIDNWVSRLSEFLVRDAGSPPSGALQLEAEPYIAYSAGVAVTAQHMDIVWVSANRPMRFIGREANVLRPVRPLMPLSERTWFNLDVETEISAVYTPTAFVSKQLWPALDAFNSLVQDYAATVWAEEAQASQERYRSATLSRRASTALALRHIGSVLAGAEAIGTTETRDAERTPLQVAAGLVADSIGAVLTIPRSAGREQEVLDAAAGLARASGIWTRRIWLAAGWWRWDGPSFVGMKAGDGSPLAVLADGRGGYRAVDPSAGKEFSVGEKQADGIAGLGLMFYAPLPARINNGLAALRHVLRGFGAEFRIVLAMGVLGGLFALATPVLIGHLLADVIPRFDVSLWVAFLSALFLGALGSTVFGIVRALVVLRIETRGDERLQSAVWSRLLSLQVQFFRKYSAGDLADRANGISQIRQLITGGVASGMIQGLFSVFSLGLLFWYSWRLALYATALVGVLLGATWMFARGQMRHHRAVFRIQGVINGLVFQMITGLDKIRIANVESHALKRWAERFAEQKSETLAARRWAAGQFAFNSLFSPLASLVIFAGILFVLFESQPSFGLASFLSFHAAFGQFMVAITGLTSSLTTMVAVVPLFERVEPILTAEPESTVAGVEPGELIGDIEFANVSFRYQPNAPNVMNDVSFRIRAGDNVAFVGASGSGKSTIYRLLLGFEQPTSGLIFLDGHDLASLDMPMVRRRMGVVLQNGHLAATSIFENIVGSSSLTMEEAWAAAKAAGLAKDIEEMPMGMHTMLSENGGALSGGQKQRLLIARALVRKPRIVLFDEATSALDNCSQEIVQESLKKLSATRLVIAHRLSSIKAVDRIYVIDAGRIVESGRYNDLMARDGVFAQLARRQII